MATKCAVCEKEIGIVFLEKIDGTFVRGKDKKKKAVCSACQRTSDLHAL